MFLCATRKTILTNQKAISKKFTIINCENCGETLTIMEDKKNCTIICPNLAKLLYCPETLTEYEIEDFSNCDAKIPCGVVFIYEDGGKQNFYAYKDSLEKTEPIISLDELNEYKESVVYKGKTLAERVENRSVIEIFIVK